MGLSISVGLRVALLASALACCGRFDPALPSGLRINEVVSQNEGVWIDEFGETDDYVEFYNTSSDAKSLADYVIVDDGGETRLPDLTIAPYARMLLWADDTPEQGPLHLPFKISSLGETLRLVREDGVEVDRVHVPPLGEHHAYSRMPDGLGRFADCGWATPGRANGDRCGPPDVEEPVDDLVFLPFSWPTPWPATVLPLTLSEIRVDPDPFVEVHNTTNRTLRLDDFELWVAPHHFGNPWPLAAEGAVVALPSTEIGPGERVSIDVPAANVAPILASPLGEGVFTLVERGAVVVDRIDFSSSPPGAVLARFPEPDGGLRYCTNATPGEPNAECTELESRNVKDHERRLLTPGDFHALAEGKRNLGIESVEFVLDMQPSGDTVTFLNSKDWDLHYTFVREVIQGLPHLDRCDPLQRQLFNQGWYEFSNLEYFRVEGRRYLLGTLIRYAGTDYLTVEFTSGDAISAAQMHRAFFAVLRNVSDPKRWVIRPQAPDQVQRLRTIEGQLPIIGTNAPFRDVTFQPLTPAVAFGTLRFVPADEIRSVPLTPRDIVVTDQVPNDIPLIGGLITEAFQTPLAHVNILSRGRNTPNMALRNARNDPRLTPYFGELVRLEVDGTDFTLGLADPQEALDFWESRKPVPRPPPRLDDATRGVVALERRGLRDLPTIGGKAAQVGELLRVPLCAGPVSVPHRPFAIAVVHSVEHFEASGGRALLEELMNDAEFLADPLVRARGLASVRRLIKMHPVDRELLIQVEHAIGERWVGEPLRFRSSSNTEDLPGFSGAGLYSSEGLDVDEVDSGVEDAIREVWASLWLQRAFDERDYYGVDQRAVAMAVLVHPAYRSERINGVAISRDALQPTRGDRFYINAQVGEALVTNPAPGIDSDEITFDPYRAPYATYHSHSTFSPIEPVMTQNELAFLSCNLAALNQYFRPLLDPNQENSWFAVDIEFKLMGPERALVIKQTRPYNFGEEPPSGWCDF